LEARIISLQDELDSERRRRAADERRASQAVAGDLTEQAESVDGVKMLVARVEAANQDAMGRMGDSLKQRLGSSVLVLGAVIDERPTFLGMVTPDLSERVNAGKIIGSVAQEAGGRGGGRPEMARGAGADSAKLGAALDLARRLIKESLSGSD
jgi:alanyl-tRNA synthetase